MNKAGQKLELPHVLVEAVKDQRAVVVFGAGASMECTDKKGNRPPNGHHMRDHLALKFLGTRDEERDLATVAEMAIANGAGQPAVFEEISNLLSGFPPSNAHKKLADFRWRGFATTNYDTIVEHGYAENQERKQTCLPFVKDTEPFEDRLRAQTNPLALLKLHGCLNHRLDPDIPLVLSNEHYHRFIANRKLLFGRLRDWAQSSPLIFVGYGLADPHLRSLVYEINAGHRPRWYIVSPDSDEHDVKLWSSMSVDVIDATFGEFLDALDHQIPSLFRSLSPPEGVADEPYRKHFRTHDAGSDILRQSFKMDLSRFCAAPCARLGYFPFESDRAFPAQC